MTERPASVPAAAVEQILERHQHELAHLVRREAGAPLLRFEEPEDLVQGVRLHVLRVADKYEPRSEAETRAWLRRLARRYLRDRRDHWFALRRGGGKVLRHTLRGSASFPELGPALIDSTHGPRTRADHREQIVQLSRALDLLLPRDRLVVQWISEGAATEELMTRLDLGRAATERVRSRAFSRLRRAWRVIERFEN